MKVLSISMTIAFVSNSFSYSGKSLIVMLMEGERGYSTLAARITAVNIRRGNDSLQRLGYMVSLISTLSKMLIARCMVSVLYFFL
jgi:hypothetical protein